MNFSDIDTSPEGQRKAINEMAGLSNEKYEYSFCLWPDEKWNFPYEIFEVFECLKGRMVFDWTPKHFEQVRSALSDYGLVMHEISRRPFCKEEIVL